jgi:photosystem II stability/assembly factor-like uncharacterized protein
MIYFRSIAACLFAPAFLIAANWKAIGPFGGSASIVRVDERHPGMVLAATANALLFRSQDNGESWSPLAFPAELRATLHAFVVDPRNAGVYFAGLSSEDALYSGILLSSDSGVTWKRLANPELRSVWSIALFPQDSHVMAAGTEEGVFLSHDRGATWQRITPENQPDMRPVVALSFDPADSKIIYAGTPHLAWKTSDGGENWNSIHKGMLDDSDVFSILVDDRQRRRLFAGTCGGMYRSLDGGANWLAVAQLERTSSRTYFVTQHPRLPNVLFAGTAGGLLRSIDSGKNWRQLSSESTRSVAFDPAEVNRIFVATDDTGLFRSDDLGDALVAVNNGFCNRHFTSFVGTQNTLYLSMGTSGTSAILERDTGDTAWREAAPKLQSSGVVRLVASESGLLYATSALQLLVSSAHARSWTSLPAASDLVAVLFTSPDGRTLLAAADNAVYRTLDGAETWETVEAPREIYEIVSTASKALLAASSLGLLKSTDGGKSWAPTAGVLAAGSVRAICKHPSRPGQFFASQYGTIFRSRDGGRSWMPLLRSDQSVQALVVIADDPDGLFVLVQNRGVYRLDIPDD